MTLHFFLKAKILNPAKDACPEEAVAQKRTVIFLENSAPLIQLKQMTWLINLIGSVPFTVFVEQLRVRSTLSNAQVFTLMLTLHQSTKGDPKTIKLTYIFHTTTYTPTCLGKLGRSKYINNNRCLVEDL